MNPGIHSQAGHMLLALRAGAMTREQLRARFGDSYLGMLRELAGKGLAEWSSPHKTSIHITDKGLSACPRRRDVLDLRARADTEHKARMTPTPTYATAHTGGQNMARKRIESAPALKNWNDVDAALAEIARLDREIRIYTVSQDEEIDLIKEKAKLATAPLMAAKAMQEMAIKEFAEAHRDEFAKTKTRELTYGFVGFRKSSSIVIRRVAETLKALHERGLSDCILRRESPNKDAMRQLPEDTLHAVGATLKTADVFWYESKTSEIAEVTS